MKWQALSLGFLASAAIASPIDARDEKLTVYNLRVSSRERILNRRLLSLKNNTVGVHSEDAPSVKVYTVQDRGNSSLVQLHTYPIGIIDHALAVAGAQTTGLYSFQDVSNPASTTVPVGTTLDWSSFTLGSNVTAAGKPANTVTYTKGNGRWAAFPKGDGEWSVMWKSANAITTDNYMLIDVVYEEAPLDRRH